jgi:hypothetical protein
MESVGLRFASNVALALYRPDDRDLHFYSGIHQVGHVTEVCVLTYVDCAIGNKLHYRALTITGSSWQETRTLLLRAYESNVESVVILTHPFEYVKRRQSDFSRLRRNRINQLRLVRLCEFLRDNSDRYEVATMVDLALSPQTAPRSTNVALKVPAIRTIERMLQNTLNDRIPTL